MQKDTSCTPCAVKNWILLGIPLLFVIGSFMHFAYDLSGESIIVGIFAPVNESVWEHLKMSFWPMLIWWVVGYFVLRNRTCVSKSKWIVGCATAIIVCPLVIVSFYYTYTGALGIESLILDIFSLFLGITIAQITALHIYNYSNPGIYCVLIAFMIIVLMAIAFIVFTFSPPQIPLFQDSVTGKYGI